MKNYLYWCQRLQELVHMIMDPLMTCMHTMSHCRYHLNVKSLILVWNCSNETLSRPECMKEMVHFVGNIWCLWIRNGPYESLKPNMSRGSWYFTWICYISSILICKPGLHFVKVCFWGYVYRNNFLSFWSCEPWMTICHFWIVSKERLSGVGYMGST